jgi:hypothetical protein
MTEPEDHAARLLRETFADAEHLLTTAQAPITVRSPHFRRTPMRPAAAVRSLGLRRTPVRPGTAVRSLGFRRTSVPPGADEAPVAVRSGGFRRMPGLLAAAAVLAIVGGSLYAAGRDSKEPRPAATVTATPTPHRSETAQIYAAVIASASAFDQPPRGWPKVFIVDAPYDGVAGTRGTPRPGRPFDPAIRADIERSIRSVAPVVWVSDRGEATVTRDGCDTVREDGLLITIGPILRFDDHVEVGVNAFHSCLGAHWTTYRVEPGSGGAWRVTGIVGPQAIS